MVLQTGGGGGGGVRILNAIAHFSELGENDFCTQRQSPFSLTV